MELGNTETSGVIVVKKERLVSSLTFDDGNLTSCVIDTARSLNLQFVSQMESLLCDSLNIRSTAGVDQLTVVTSLSLNDNELTTLGVRSNTALTYLPLNNTPLKRLDVSSNTALTYLSVYDNNLTQEAKDYLDTINKRSGVIIRF